MRIRQKIPVSQLVDDTGVLARPIWLLAELCVAGAANPIEPPFEVFYPPEAAPFDAGWSLARFLSSSWAMIYVPIRLGGGVLGEVFLGREWLITVLIFVTIVFAVGLGLLLWWRLNTHDSLLQIRSLTLSDQALRLLYEDISAIISIGKEAGIKNLALTVSNKYYSQNIQ